MGKLVRDGIPDIIRASGAEPVLRVLDQEEYRTALLEKLVEEAEEASASDSEHLLEELADVYEIILAALKLHDWSVTDLVSAARRKADERGVFGERIWLD